MMMMVMMMMMMMMMKSHDHDDYSTKTEKWLGKTRCPNYSEMGWYWNSDYKALALRPPGLEIVNLLVIKYFAHCAHCKTLINVIYNYCTYYIYSWHILNSQHVCFQRETLFLLSFEHKQNKVMQEKINSY